MNGVVKEKRQPNQPNQFQMINDFFYEWPVISVIARISPTQPSPLWKEAHRWDALSKKVP